MRLSIHGLGLALLVGCAAGVSAQSLRSERLVAPRLDDWKIGYYHTTDQQVVRKEVPHGQSADLWQRMVITQRLKGDAAALAPADYARDFAASITQACPGARATPIRNGRKSGYAAALVRVDCAASADAGGQQETTFLLAISGQDELHVKQVAFRGGLGPADGPWVERYMSGVALCADGDKAPVCLR